MGQVTLLLLWEDSGGREDTVAALMVQVLGGLPLPSLLPLLSRLSPPFLEHPGVGC